MELFTIWTETNDPMEAQCFYQTLKCKGRGLHMSRYGLSFSFSQFGNRVAWTCKHKGREKVDQAALMRVKTFVVDAFARYVQQQWELKLLHAAVFEECRYMSGEEVQRIYEISSGLLCKDLNSNCDKRKSILISALVQCFSELDVVNLEGVIRFRLSAYKQELMDIVEYALDEYWGERKYEEFIQLLKYFVYFQEHQVSLVHVVHTGEHNFTILDTEMKRWNPLDAAPITVELPSLEIEMPAEDMIVSNLISIAPARIMLHTQNPGAFVVHTLINIFGDKVELCHFCPDCGTWLNDTNRLDGKEANHYNNCEIRVAETGEPVFFTKS